MKEYFSHDYNTTLDPKIIALLGDYGAIGYGIYWRIVEMLHSENEHKLPLKEYIYKALAQQMVTSVEQISTIINDCINVYELFIEEDGNFYSKRVLENIEKMEETKEKRSRAGKISAELRKNSTCVQQNLTSVQQNLTQSNKIKENKRKENKENKNKEEIKKEEKKKFSFDFSNFDVRFIDVIKTWLEYKKERKEQYRGQKSLDAFYKNLVKLSENNPETATLIIEQSMGNNWAGIFKPKDSDKPKLQNDTYKRKAIISGNSLQLL